MLTTKQLQIPLIFYHWCSEAGLLIFKVDHKNGEIETRTDKYRVRIWKFLMICSFTRGLFALWRYISLSLSSTETISMETIPFFFLHSTGHFSVILMSWNAYLLKGEITCMIFNTLNEGRVSRTTWKSITIQELVVLTTPFNWSALVCIYIAIVYSSPNAAYNLHSIINKEAQNELTNIACVILEAIIGGFGLINLLAATSIAMLHLQKCIEVGQSHVNALKNSNMEHRRLNQIVRSTRQLQLHAKFHNEGYRYSHFYGKILALSGFIVMESCGIILLHQHPNFAFLYIFFGLECCLVYCILFHKAFKLPILVNKSKTRLRNLTKKNVPAGLERKILLTKIRSLPVVSIKSGSFNSFEKMSTPNFLGFGIKQVIRVLIAHRKPT